MCIFVAILQETKNNERKLKLWFCCTRCSVSSFFCLLILKEGGIRQVDVWYVATSHTVAYIRASWSYTDSVDAEVCMYACGPCYGLSVESHCPGNQQNTTAIFGRYFVFIMDVHDVIYAAQTHSSVKSKLKLRLQNNVGAIFSWPYVCRKPKIKKM